MRKAYKIVPLLVLLTACAHADNPQVVTPAMPASAVMAEPAPAPVSAASAALDARTGVGFVGAGIEPEAPKVVVKEVDPYQPIKIRVTGQGTVPVSKSLTAAQRKLLGIRAAKLDAFRAIAEQVQGMKLVGNSSVANMVSVSDSFRTYVDAYLRGVNVISTSIQADGTSEVIAEIVLDKDFYLQFKSALQQTGSVMKAAQQSGAQGVQCGADNCASARYGSNFYNAQ
ncbi:LPP20 family lipoprotein [Paludibacterium sp. B53371]|uniref:LPP20 family lipoprotein n=1 Tax=Paludibacterium sp. B53371 TaxID=2806263 RepID=UPI00207B28D5|nr:LPP20 family lipoprotein [Paludibacterium sp. B53371]